MNKSFWLLILTISLFWACTSSGPEVDKANDYIVLRGKTMGTTYNITYESSTNQNLQTQIDSVLAEVNKGVNTYDPTSLISQFNQSEEAIELDIELPTVQHFLRNWQLAGKVYEATSGKFDPTVMPLVNYWGFGYDGSRLATKADSTKVDSLVQFVGFDKVVLEELMLKKTNQGVELDFSACAKGYGVDRISLFLESKGCQNYFVDIGGDGKAKGKSPKNRPWRIGINTPKEGAAITDFQQLVKLSDLALTTSGNYRNFYEVDGVKYSHTINPQTGFPERNTLLSASAFAKDCMTADAFSTAFMAMGLDKAYELASETDGIEAYLVYSDDRGKMKVKYTAGVNAFLIE